MLTVIIGAIIVGMILGLLGSGGSAIMVPILVYLVGHDAKISIAESMAIVGAISVAGAIPYARKNLIDWNSVGLFGVPAMVGTFIGAWLGGLASDAVQLTVFGAVLLLSAGLMFRKAFGKKQNVDEAEATERPTLNLRTGLLIVVEGIVVGALTGFVGVGGGFLIVPALFILGKLPMRMAIATSLVIIVMKSLVGFLKYQQFLTQHGMSVDWATIAIFVAIGSVGCVVGQQLNSRLNQRALKQAFAVFLVLIGGFVMFREGGKLFRSAQQPVAPVVTAEEIRTFQADEKHDGEFVIVDVRSKAESDVSLIPGAITQAAFEKTKNQYAGKTVIAYCTVGHRSGIYAKKLRSAGWDARNYEGSILDWCKNQLPVVTPTGESTKRVHTYNSSYALDSNYQAVY